MNSTECPTIQSSAPFMCWSTRTNIWAVGFPLRKDVSCMRLTKHGERWAIQLSLIWSLLKWGKWKWMGWIYQQFFWFTPLPACFPPFLLPLYSFSSPSLFSFLPPSLCFPLSSPIHSFLKRVHWVKTVTVKLKKGQGGCIFRVSGLKVSVWIQHIYKSLAESPLGFSLTFCLMFAWAEKTIQ